jgi:hypothetical protein
MTTLNVFNEVFGLATSDDFVFSGDENGTLKVSRILFSKSASSTNEHSRSGTLSRANVCIPYPSTRAQFMHSL